MSSVPTACRNTYLLMRHGHSEANQQGRIVSAPCRGVASFGLSDRGRKEVDESLVAWRWATPTRVVHSDFLRTTQTAQRVAEWFDVGAVVDRRLRERDFGELEGQSDARYAEAWARDALDAGHQCQGVEAVDRVAGRLLAVIRDLEQASCDECVLLVSHGDPLQILLTALEGRDLRQHRDRALMQPADVMAWPPPVRQWP